VRRAAIRLVPSKTVALGLDIRFAGGQIFARANEFVQEQTYSGCTKTFRYSNVFFYNHLCRNFLFRNIIMESGITGPTVNNGKLF